MLLNLSKPVHQIKNRLLNCKHSFSEGFCFIVNFGYLMAVSDYYPTLDSLTLT